MLVMELRISMWQAGGTFDLGLGNTRLRVWCHVSYLQELVENRFLLEHLGELLESIPVVDFSKFIFSFNTGCFHRFCSGVCNDSHPRNTELRELKIKEKFCFTT